jgi:non-canonical purine NTP pyrophosphatase (RdgB/HAM1 family)
VKLYCATTNGGKLREFKLIVAHYGRGAFEVEPLENTKSIAPCEETGATFEENAAQKAHHYGAHAPGLLFADDSGLEVDTLDGAPGIYSARYAGEHAGDEANNRLLLENLRDKPNRAARFVCAIALADNGKPVRTFRGQVEGRIIDTARGPNGFGYDPLFFHEAFGCTFGEASAEQKLLVSHRVVALAAMLEYLSSRNASK